MMVVAGFVAGVAIYHLVKWLVLRPWRPLPECPVEGCRNTATHRLWITDVDAPKGKGAIVGLCLHHVVCLRGSGLIAFKVDGVHEP